MIKTKNPNPCILNETNIRDMYKEFKSENPDKPLSMFLWANKDEYICENKDLISIGDPKKYSSTPCNILKEKAKTCALRMADEEQKEEQKKEETNVIPQYTMPTLETVDNFNREFEEHEKGLNPKTEYRDYIEDKSLINAWNAISTNNKLDSGKATSENLREIAKALKDPEIHTYDKSSNTYIIPDGQFDEIIKKLKGNMIMSQVGLTQQRIEYHKKDRTDFKAKNNKFYSPTLSKSWKKYTTWGGIKTRKYKKGKKSKNGKKGKKGKKTKKYKTRKRNYKK